MDLKRAVFLLIIFFFIPSCSIRQIAVQASSDIVNNVQLSFMEEKDPELAKEALPGLIKIAEGMYRYYPNSPYYSGKLCFLLAAYTFAYLDDTPYSDYDDESETKEARLLEYYARAYAFGLESLNRRIPNFKSDIISDPDTALKKVKERDIETLFWFNFSWAMRIFNNTADIKLVLELETVKKVADTILRVKPDYLNYAVYAVYLAYYGGRSEAIGGDPQRALAFYNKGLELSDGKNSILDFVYLKFVATQKEDDTDFNEVYERIVDFDPESDPKYIFIHRVIQEKANLLYNKKEEFF